MKITEKEGTNGPRFVDHNRVHHQFLDLAHRCGLFVQDLAVHTKRPQVFVQTILLGRTRAHLIGRSHEIRDPTGRVKVTQVRAVHAKSEAINEG